MRHSISRISLALMGALALGACALGPDADDEGTQDESAAVTTWSGKVAPLGTPWTSQVSPSNALPDYPRPQLVRNDWLNLNGLWEFSNASSGQAPPVNQHLAEKVLVPYPIEAALSGIQRHQDRMWYRRTFQVPAGCSGRRVQLNFGAVDWEATVYVNGAQVGSHRGGYTGFSFDITDKLHSGDNEIIVGVFDPTDSGGQPLGKQRNTPDGIFYTAASGIWQTVWLEPTTAAHVTRLDATPDLVGERLRLTVRAAGASGSQVEVRALASGVEVGRASGKVDGEVSLPVPKPHLWSPDDPFLYDLEVTLKDGSGAVDQVKSYFGMRSVGMKIAGGVLRPVLNGKFVFQMGTLDQGYWPDGIYTAPTDEALKFDIQKHKDLGFNLIRKHIKVEPQRWFYWADKLGVLVWQDMPAMKLAGPSTDAQVEFERELKEIIDEHRSATAVVNWVVENEGWGQFDQARLATLVKSFDPTRLVNNMSGIDCCGTDGGNGDMVDYHQYPGPAAPFPTAQRSSVLGEFGGVGLRVAGHEWAPGKGFSYVMVNNGAELTQRYVSLIQQTQALIARPGLSAAIYTEITDVENEANGLLTYDRQVVKGDAAQIRAVNQAIINASTDPAFQGILQVGVLRSFQVRTPGLTTRYMRHFDGLGVTAEASGASPGVLKADASFRVQKGLADPSCYSLESKNFPGQFLRHFNSRIQKAARDGSSGFDQDATFCARPALDGSAEISLESKNFPGKYLRHRGGELWVDAFEDTTGFRQDASWTAAAPLWRSNVDLPVNQLRSFQAVTDCCTNRSIRHSNGLAFTEVVDGGSNATLKADATFRIVPGLADESCYSFESKNFPGEFLRHKESRLRRDPRESSAVYNQDATFCATTGNTGKGIALESYNFPGKYLRHYESEVWLSGGVIKSTYETPMGFTFDSTWSLINPWSP